MSKIEITLECLFHMSFSSKQLKQTSVLTLFGSSDKSSEYYEVFLIILPAELNTRSHRRVVAYLFGAACRVFNQNPLIYSNVGFEIYRLNWEVIFYSRTG